jgi:hypothetical protein
MRAYHKGWQSDRPMKRTTRRVKWYQNSTGDGPDLSIRLKFDDQYGEVSDYFTDRAEATARYEAFIAGEFSTWDLMKREPMDES